MRADLSSTSSGGSLAHLARLTLREKAKILRGATQAECAELATLWEFWARPEQLAPEWAWHAWVILSGRGWGKTRTGAEWIHHIVRTGQARRIALVARTAADVRDVVVGGESGILNVGPARDRPVWEPSKRLLTWPNGAIATTFSAEQPDALRGPQHDFAWCDELAAWQYADDAWSNLLFGLRLGARPQVLVTTTPRPTRIIRSLISQPTTAVTRGKTRDNAANLAPTALSELERQYAGTRLGRQELEGEILDDSPGALWKRDQIDALRVRHAPEMIRIVVAIDPAATSSEGADETGIVVCGLGRDRQGYVLADKSGRYSPGEWAALAVKLYGEWQADGIVAEVNNGGEMVGHTVATVTNDRGERIGARVPFRAVHASRGKRIRAEPIAALYEQGRIHHVGAFPGLEDQMCVWDAGTGETSPDRIDAMVWGFTDLDVGGGNVPISDLSAPIDDGRWGNDARGF